MTEELRAQRETRPPMTKGCETVRERKESPSSTQRRSSGWSCLALLACCAVAAPGCAWFRKLDLTTLRNAELRDRSGTIGIQERCYRGSYLGTSSLEEVCTVNDRAFFWDTVHPATYTHCWVA